VRKLTYVASALILAASSAPAYAADPSIEAFEAAQAAAWNAHDAATYTAAFDPDADIVTANGWHWAGQAEAARNLADGFKIVFARARFGVSEVEARALAPDVSLVTLAWVLDGARTIDGAQEAGPQHGFETQVLQRRGTGWAILSQQDTAAGAPLPQSEAYPDRTATPATAFPTTPPPVRRCVIARANGDCVLYGKPKQPK
jgi:uncharacterized protein (TIGR02246 family)